MLNTFSYGEISSEIYGITCDTETHYILPEQKKYVKEIPGMDGVIDFGIGGYGVRTMTVNLYFDGDYSSLRANRENIIAWLSNRNGQAKQLVFSNDPTRYYMAKIYAALDFINTSVANTHDGSIGTVQFECNPPWSYKNGVAQTPEEIAWQTAIKSGNQYMQEFTESGYMRFSNSGKLPVKPKIKLLNNVQSGLTLSYNGSDFKYNSTLINDGIIIDCANETVTKSSDGANLFANIDPAKDTFFELDTGQINIDITSMGLNSWPNNLIVIVEFIPMGVG